MVQDFFNTDNEDFSLKKNKNKDFVHSIKSFDIYKTGDTLNISLIKL